jgi:hypothetical protein
MQENTNIHVLQIADDKVIFAAQTSISAPRRASPRLSVRTLRSLYGCLHAMATRLCCSLRRLGLCEWRLMR